MIKGHIEVPRGNAQVSIATGVVALGHVFFEDRQTCLSEECGAIGATKAIGLGALSHHIEPNIRRKLDFCGQRIQDRHTIIRCRQRDVE